MLMTQWVRRIILALALVSLTSTQAAAGPSEAAKARSQKTYQAGVALFKAGQFRAAIREFNKAYRDSPSPTLLYNIARAFEELGEYKLAVDSYREYLKIAPNAPDRQRVERTLTTLERLNASGSAEAELSIESTPIGARVMIDEEPAGVTPKTVTVTPGMHVIRVSKAGYQTADITQKVLARRSVSLNVALRPVSVVEVEESMPSWVPWTLTGTGACSVLAGLVAIGIAQSAADDARSLGPSREDISRYHDLRSEHARATGAGTVGVTLGVAVLTTGLYWLFSREAPSKKVAVDSSGLGWGGEF